MDRQLILDQLLRAAGIPIDGVGDGTPLRIDYLPEATAEQRAQAESIRDVDLPAYIAAEQAREAAYAGAAASGCPVTINGRTIVFAATVEDYTTLIADLGGMVDLDAAGEPDAPEYLKGKDGELHKCDTRAEARAFVREYRRAVKSQWAALWTQQEAARVAEQS